MATGFLKVSFCSENYRVLVSFQYHSRILKMIEKNRWTVNWSIRLDKGRRPYTENTKPTECPRRKNQSNLTVLLSRCFNELFMLADTKYHLLPSHLEIFVFSNLLSQDTHSTITAKDLVRPKAVLKKKQIRTTNPPLNHSLTSLSQH